MHNYFGEHFCNALPGLHALTGCDFNPSFFRKGKKSFVDLVYKESSYRDALIDVGNIKNIENLSYDDFLNCQIFKKIEKLLCVIYGFKNLECLHTARVEQFKKTFKVRNVNGFLKKNMKSIDPTSVPPCKSELYMQLLRTSLITHVWQNAYKCEIEDINPAKFGWKLVVDGDRQFYDFNWFYGDQMPRICDIIVEETTHSDDEGKDRRL